MRLVLADTSAWSRSDRASARWRDLLDAGVLAICTPVMLELLLTARRRSEYERLADDLSRLPILPIDRRVEHIALRTQAALAGASRHRRPKPIDLLIAATAEVSDAILLHYDRHFDLIARVTGQPAEWLARRGSID